MEDKMIEPNTKLTPKEKAIEFFMKEEVRLLDSGTLPTYPLQLDKTIEEALKEQAKQIFQEIDNVIIDIYSEDKGRVDMDLNIRKIRDKWLK